MAYIDNLERTIGSIVEHQYGEDVEIDLREEADYVPDRTQVTITTIH